MLRPSSRAGVAPRWAGELRGDGFGISSSQAQKCFVAGRFVSSRERGPQLAAEYRAVSTTFRRTADDWQCPFSRDLLWSDSGAAHASPLRRDSIFHAGPFRPSNQLFEQQA